MKLKQIICTGILLCFCVSVQAQQQFPIDTTDTFLEKYGPATYLDLSGEAIFTTYGAAISFPVLWIENRVKVQPLVGLFWNNFGQNGQGITPALGVKALFYFRIQFWGAAPVNSFYAGLSGLSNEVDFGMRSITYQSRAGLILGYDYSLFRFVKMAPELQFMVNVNGEFRPTLGLVIHFGR